MSDNTIATGGLIGPNAILQLLPVLERHGKGTDLKRLLDLAGIREIPDGSAMIDEALAAALHRALRADLPFEAAQLAREAGQGTGKYVLAHRIPRLAKAMLVMLPPELAARALSRAITRNAWTFSGSGRFRALTAWNFEIEDNPMVRGEDSDRPLCQWHASVFETLYRSLVSRSARCREVGCCAQGDTACRFEVSR